MNSRERILNAIGRKAVDHVPLYLRLWDMGGGVDNFPFPWREQVSRVENLLRLGVDDTLLLQPPLGFTEEYNADKSPGVTGVTVTRSEPTEAGAHPLLEKTYQTPDGELSQIVKITKDWPHGEDIMLFSDFNIGRQVEPLIKTGEDIKRLRHLLASPTESQVSAFRDLSRQVHVQAERFGVALDGGWSALGDSAIWLCGINNIVRWQMKQPELLEELMDVLLEWELERVGLLLEEGIDVMVHMAWYEGTDFWTPKNFRRIIRPRLQQIIDLVHAENVPFRYIITKGWKPLREDQAARFQFSLAGHYQRLEALTRRFARNGRGLRDRGGSGAGQAGPPSG